MHRKVRVLGIAPYDNMKALMLNLAQERDDIELTVFVGDLQQGVELAKRNFYNDYDAIVSRGGTGPATAGGVGSPCGRDRRDAL